MNFTDVTMEEPDLLDCPICCQALSAPAYQCENGHVVCDLCCKKIRHKCPSCSKDKFYRLRVIEKIVESTKTSCVNCKERLSYHKKLEHEKTCKFTPVPCKNKKYGCMEIIIRKMKPEHEKTCNYSFTRVVGEEVARKRLPIITSKLLIAAVIVAEVFFL